MQIKNLLPGKNKYPDLLDIIRQNSIDDSEYFTYTDYRTNVCVYNGCERGAE